MAAVAMVAASVGSILFSGAAEGVPVPWKNCGTPSDPIVVTKFDASVWPPQRGKPETLSWAYNVSRDIVVRREFQIVEPPGLGKIPTPLNARLIKAGPYTGSNTFTVSDSIPSGSVFSVQFLIFDRTWTQVFCLGMVIPIK
jgi:hypothetical protein